MDADRDRQRLPARTRRARGGTGAAPHRPGAPGARRRSPGGRSAPGWSTTSPALPPRSAARLPADVVMSLPELAIPPKLGELTNVDAHTFVRRLLARFDSGELDPPIAQCSRTCWRAPAGGAARHRGPADPRGRCAVAAAGRPVPAQALDARAASDRLGVGRLVALELEAELRVELERAARDSRVDAQRSLLVTPVAQLARLIASSAPAMPRLRQSAWVEISSVQPRLQPMRVLLLVDERLHLADDRVATLRDLPHRLVAQGLSRTSRSPCSVASRKPHEPRNAS